MTRDIEDATAAASAEAAMALDMDSTLLQLLPEGGNNPERNLRAAARLQLPDHAIRLVQGARLNPGPFTRVDQ